VDREQCLECLATLFCATECHCVSVRCEVCKAPFALYAGSWCIHDAEMARATGLEHLSRLEDIEFAAAVAACETRRGMGHYLGVCLKCKEAWCGHE
jgi:hypothetical protein